MLTKKELFKIGRLQKSHGIRGEITLFFDESAYADIETDFYFLDIESIFVPFLIEEITITGDTAGRVKFEDIDNETKASRLSNIEIYIRREDLPQLANEAPTGWNYFVGFSILDQNGVELGIIDHVDTSTINNLFILKNGEEELLIPATEDFIVRIDEEERRIFMRLPEGLIDESLSIIAKS